MSTSGSARDNGSQNVQTISKTVAFNTIGIGTSDTVKVGRVPAGAQLLPTVVNVTTAFNAATTNVMTVGTSAGSDADIVAASDFDETALGGTLVNRGLGITFAVDTDIYVKYTQSGTAATAGVAQIVIPFVSLANG
jgi:hypothetical protein